MYRKTDRIYQAEKAFGQDRKEQVGLKNKKKTDLRSGAKAAAEKPISNIDKNDKAVILDRIRSAIRRCSETAYARSMTIDFQRPFSSLIPIISLLNLRNKTAFSQSTAI